MGDISNLMRREAEPPANARSPNRMAEVTSYNKKTHAVKLKIQPEGQETGWVPLGGIAIGNGFGIAVGAKAGDLVMVSFVDGDHSSPVVISRIFSDTHRPPEVKGGEFAIWHESGTRAVYAKDGSVTRTHAKGGTQTWAADGTHTHDNKDLAVNTKAGSMKMDTPTQVVTGAVHLATG